MFVDEVVYLSALMHRSDKEDRLCDKVHHKLSLVFNEHMAIGLA